MKIPVLVFCAFLCISFAAIGTADAAGGIPQAGSIGFVVKAGFDTMGEMEGDFGDFGGPTETGDIKNGFSLALDGLMGFQGFMLGVGVSYLVPRGGDGTDAPEGKFSTVPVYGVLNLPFGADRMTPFLAVQIGYNFLILDSTMKKWFETASGGADIGTEGGFYYAIGGGIIFDNNIQVELLYRVHMFKVTGEKTGISGAIDCEYTHITISVGYRF